MSWEVLQSSCNRNIENTIRISMGVDRNKEGKKSSRTKIRFAKGVLKAVGFKRDDKIDVLFDVQNGLIGFRKESSGNGFKLSGKHLALYIQFSTPMNKYGKMIAAAVGKEIEPTVDGKMIKIKVGVPQ